MKLPPPDTAGKMPLEAAMVDRRSVREYADKPLSLSQVSQLLWAGQGVTRQEGRRAAPSAGALYPLELYLVAGNVKDLAAGVYRYDSKEHRLELAAAGDLRAEVATVALEQEWMADAACILVIAGVAQRMVGKYHDRTGRYIILEAGHAAQNVLLQAVSLGLGTAPVGAFKDGELKRIAALDEKEEPLYMLTIGYRRT